VDMPDASLTEFVIIKRKPLYPLYFKYQRYSKPDEPDVHIKKNGRGSYKTIRSAEIYREDMKTRFTKD